MDSKNATLESSLASITESVAKLSEQLALQKDDELNKEEDNLDIRGVREQILANVEILFPALIHGSKHRLAVSPEPKFHLITVGTTNMYARVLYSFPASDGMRTPSTVLINGPDARSTAQALKPGWAMVGRTLDKPLSILPVKMAAHDHPSGRNDMRVRSTRQDRQDRR